MTMTLNHPACPLCLGAGVLHGADQYDGQTFKCKPCDGYGYIAECPECHQPLGPDAELTEVGGHRSTGLFVCERCSREPAPEPETDTNLEDLESSIALATNARALGITPRGVFQMARRGRKEIPHV